MGNIKIIKLQNKMKKYKESKRKRYFSINRKKYCQEKLKLYEKISYLNIIFIYRLKKQIIRKMSIEIWQKKNIN